MVHYRQCHLLERVHNLRTWAVHGMLRQRPPSSRAAQALSPGSAAQPTKGHGVASSAVPESQSELSSASTPGRVRLCRTSCQVHDGAKASRTQTNPTHLQPGSLCGRCLSQPADRPAIATPR